MVAALAGRAHAEDPWEKGVSAEQQDAANALFAEGNALFAQQAHAPALEKYKAAIAIWDHPAIRFNMAVTLIRLDRMLEAADELEKALRFGATPFAPEMYQQALDFQILVRKQLGYVEATCTQPDAHISLDGKPWFEAPGTQKLRVTTGEHVIVAERKGYMTSSRRVVVAGGATVNETLELLPVDSAVLLKYPYPKWVPWTVTGGGVALAVSGLGVWLWGRSQMDRVQAEFAMTCPNGCPSSFSDHPSLAEGRDSARLKGNIGVSMMVTGGVATIAGVVMTVLDRPKRILPNVELAPAAGGATARVGWRF
jgi:hypothetical protein